MGIKYTNNAEGTLTAGLLSGDTTNLTLTAGDGLLFPVVVLASGDYFYATLVDVSGNVEIIKVLQHQNGTDVFQTISRAQDDTTARDFAIADKVQLRLPKIVIEELQDQIDLNTTDSHVQDTDVGTTSAIFQLNSAADGPNIKDVSGVVTLRVAADDAYANLRALGLTLEAALSVATTAAIVGIATFTAAAVFSNGLSSGGTIAAATNMTIGTSLTVGTTLAVTGATTVAALTASGRTLVRDHGTPATPEVVNVVYGTGSPPTANLTTIGTIFIKYVA